MNAKFTVHPFFLARKARGEGAFDYGGPLVAGLTAKIIREN